MSDEDYDKKIDKLYHLRKAYFEKKNMQLMMKINIISIVINVALSWYTINTLNTNEKQGNRCPGKSVKWFLFFVLLMDATNIFQSICKIFNLKHFCCSNSMIFLPYLYEFFQAFIMLGVLINSTYCEGTGQFYKCLLLNTVVNWLMLLTSIYILFRSQCTGVSRDECVKFLHGYVKRT